MRPLNLALLMAFGIGLFVLVIVAVVNDDPMGIAHAEFALPWITRAIGLFIATVSALALLWHCLEGATLDRVVVFILPLLGGLLLIERSWGTALSLGLIGVAIIVQAVFVRLPVLGGAHPPKSD